MMNKHTHTHTPDAANAAEKTPEELIDAVIERLEKCGATTEDLARFFAAVERRKAQINEAQREDGRERDAIEKKAEELLDAVIERIDQSGATIDGLKRVLAEVEKRKAQLDSAKREAADICDDVFTGVITPEECPADSAVRSELVRRFGEFARAVDDLRALAESDDEREHIARRIANVLGCLRAVAPADAATGRPAGVLGDGRVTVSLEARVDAPGDGCGFAVEFVESGDPVVETRLASLREALKALISAQLAADEVDEDEEDIEITFSDASADGNPRQFRARSRGLSLREARAALEAGELTMIEC